MIFSNIVLDIWEVLYGLKFFSYHAIGSELGVFLLISTWTADAFASDLETRAIVFATKNTLCEVYILIVLLVAWLVSHALKFGGFIWVS